MNFILWEKVFAYTSEIKYHIPEKGYLPDKVLRKKVTESFICNKFLTDWINHSTDDPIDILDRMLLNYSLWEEEAIIHNNKELIEIYNIYIKTLNNIRKYIINNLI